MSKKTEIAADEKIEKMYSETELQEIISKHQKEIAEIKQTHVKMDLSFQWYIPRSPINKNQLFGQACSSDGITVKSFVAQWLEHFKQNNALYDLKKDSVISEAKKYAMRPIIIAGSGPSLRRNGMFLKQRGEIPLVSCLHNYAYFEDMGIKPDYYVNLDAQALTIDEVTNSGSKSAEYYWDSTKDKVLVTAVHCNPELHKKWKGKILWYQTIIPDNHAMQQFAEITGGFDMFFQCGGNALGSCLYLARAVLGGGSIGFVGADFSFSYDKKFHPFDSDYDKKFDGVMACTDVFGNRVYTWQSYFNFKCWFEYQSMGGEGNNPQMFVNCTEGGILGAYPEGNIISIPQMTLVNFINLYSMHLNFDHCIEKKMLLF